MCVTVQCCRAKGLYESSIIGDFPGGFDPWASKNFKRISWGG